MYFATNIRLTQSRLKYKNCRGFYQGYTSLRGFMSFRAKKVNETTVPPRVSDEYTRQQLKLDIWKQQIHHGREQQNCRATYIMSPTAILACSYCTNHLTLLPYLCLCTLFMVYCCVSAVGLHLVLHNIAPVSNDYTAEDDIKK